MRFAKWLVPAAACALLASCSLIPVEEEQRSVPVIRSFVQSEYELAYVQVGDVLLTETVSCRYMPVSTELLAFPVGGEYFRGIYVQKGDLVEKGQLLAELNTEGLDEQTAASEAQIASLEREIRHLSEQRDLAAAGQRRLLAVDASASALTPEEIAGQYEERIRAVRDSLTVAQLRLEELRAFLEQRRLYAGIDGAVTYVRLLEDGQRSVEGESIIRISDASNSVFSAGTANYELLPDGALVTLTIRSEAWEARVVSAAELGLPDPGLDSKGQKTIYLRLVSPNASLETGDRAALTLLLEQSLDTLYIPAEALHRVGGRSFVYHQDENGLKTMIEVVPGLITNTQAEILSGLQAGDNVILG